jgi:hypothetical protein
VTARPIDEDRERVNSGYGIPRLGRLFETDFLDAQQIGSHEHLLYTVDVADRTDLHVTLSYLGPPLASTAESPLFADLDLIVVDPTGTVFRGNDITNRDALATNEEVIVLHATGRYGIHVTSNIFPIGM